MESPNDPQSMARRNLMMVKNNDYFSDTFDFLHSDRKGRITDFSLFSHSKNKNSSLNDSRLLSEADTAVSLMNPGMNQHHQQVNDSFFDCHDDILPQTNSHQSSQQMNGQSHHNSHDSYNQHHSHHQQQ